MVNYAWRHFRCDGIVCCMDLAAPFSILIFIREGEKSAFSSVFRFKRFETVNLLTFTRIAEPLGLDDATTPPSHPSKLESSELPTMAKSVALNGVLQNRMEAKVFQMYEKSREALNCKITSNTNCTLSLQRTSPLVDGFVVVADLFLASMVSPILFTVFMPAPLGTALLFNKMKVLD